MVVEVGPFVTVHKVEAGYEYRCTFCRRSGFGYLDTATAAGDAAQHRCQDRRWNEGRDALPMKEEK